MPYDPTDPLRNPLDPLHKSSPDYAVELFQRVSRVAHALPSDAVVSAACALLINAIRQASPDWARAEAMFDQYFAQSKSLLQNHYNADGRKKGVFPYDQTITARLIEQNDKVQKH